MDPDLARLDFPVLQRTWPNGSLIYFDNACSSLKPRTVAQAVAEYYGEYPVCGERSVHRLGRVVTERVDLARQRLAQFFHARRPAEILFTKNATEAINVVALGTRWRKGDVVVTTDKEHNSNWLPWFERTRTHGIKILRVPSRPDGRFDEEAYRRTLDAAGDRLRLVSVVHASNADGVVNPLARIVREAHQRGARVVADGAQSAPHHPVDLEALDVDYYAASVHKMLGPSGLGILYGKQDALEDLGPVLLGGGTVKESRPDGYDWHDLPNRFEAGLQNYAALFAVPAALDYLERAGMDAIAAHERSLNEYATQRLSEIPQVRVHGPPAAERSGILPFTLEPLDVQDVVLYLDERRNIAIRGGAFCVNPYFAAHGEGGWARASFYLYNTREEVDEFVTTVGHLARSLRGARAPAAAAR